MSSMSKRLSQFVLFGKSHMSNYERNELINRRKRDKMAKKNRRRNRNA